MKRIAMATALSCVLCVSAIAGEVPSGGYAPPAPDETAQQTVQTSLDETRIGAYSREDSTDMTLTMLQTILSLLVF